MVAVRRATKDDAAVVAEFAMKLVEQHHGYDPERFALMATIEGMKWFYGGQTEATDAAVLVAEIDSKVVGFAYVAYEEKNYAALAESPAYLNDIYVEEDARRSGGGKALIDAAVEVAKEFGASKLILSVAVKNLIGQYFFESCGFRPTMTEMTLNLQ